MPAKKLRKKLNSLLNMPVPAKLSIISRINRIKGPFLANAILKLLYLSGSILKSTCEPSKGGMGIMLKIAKIKFADFLTPSKNAVFSQDPLKNATTPFTRSLKFGLNLKYLDPLSLKSESLSEN